MRVRLPPTHQPSSKVIHSNDEPTHRHIVLGGHGHAFSISQGSRFRITDLHGEQVVDLFAWVPQTSPYIFLPLEHMSMAYTRYHLRGVQPVVGEHTYSNADQKVLRVVKDTVKVHDMTYMACYPGMIEDKPGHRSCKQNVYEAMHRFGMRDILQVPEPFNCFQNTPNYSLKAMGNSKPGDFIEFEAEENLIVAMSACPYTVDGFNGGTATDVEVAVWEDAVHP